MKISMPMNDEIENYFINGCMRCKLGATPDCKVNHWKEELKNLRKIISAQGLTEEVKWGVPCYTIDGKNVLTLSAYKEFACVSFFKGSLLTNKDGILVQPGKSSQSARYIQFTNTDQISKLKKTLVSYIKEAIEIEKSGKKVEFQKNPEPIPDELLEFFKKDKSLEKAFQALTPGKQRGYIIHFSQPKKSETRISRIEKCKTKILNGEAFY